MYRSATTHNEKLEPPKLLLYNASFLPF